MGANVDLVGPSEKKTMMNEMDWIAGWTAKLLRNLHLAYTAAWQCSTMYGPDHDYGCNGPDPAVVDTLACNLRGLTKQLDEVFDFRHVQTNEGLPLWKQIELTVEELKKQAMGIIPIPVNEYKHEPKKTKEPNSVDAGAFKSLIVEIIDLQQKLQAHLLKFFDPNDPLFPYIQIQIKYVDRQGVEMKLPDFDIDQIVNEEVERRIEQANVEKQITADAINAKQDVTQKKGKRK